MKRIHDSYDRYSSSDYVSEKNGKTGRQKADEAAESYRAGKVSALASSPGSPDEIVGNLRALEKTPIPAV